MWSHLPVRPRGGGRRRWKVLDRHRRSGYERSLWFRVRTYEGNMKCHAVDMSNYREEVVVVDDGDDAGEQLKKRMRGEKSKLVPISRKTYDSSTLVCLDSTLYCVGGFFRVKSFSGLNPRKKDVRRLDSTSPSPRWTNLVHSPMNVARNCPTAVFANGKLYVMGGFLIKETEMDRWAEVFDPETKKWSFLPKPPCIMPASGFMCAAIEDLQKIVVAGFRLHGAYVYDICQNSWAKHPVKEGGGLDFASQVPNQNLAVVGTTLYSYEEETSIMCAYECETGKSFSGKLRGLSSAAAHKIKDPCRDIRTYLFHLFGKYFCLVWAEGPTIHCTRFVVEKSSYLSGKGKCKRNGSLCACVVSSQTYYLGDKTTLYDAVIMNRSCALSTAGKTRSQQETSSAVVMEVEKPIEPVGELDLMDVCLKKQLQLEKTMVCQYVPPPYNFELWSKQDFVSY